MVNMSMKQKVNVTNWHAVGREGSKKMGNNLSMLLSIIISYTQRYKPCCSSFELPLGTFSAVYKATLRS
jgi:hypothetical protein